MRLLILFLVGISTHSTAQVIPNFSLTNVNDGKTISLEDYSTPGVVIIFTSNTCPYDSYYLIRISSLAEDYKSKIPVLLINSHNDASESIVLMESFASQCKLSMPYLADKEQKALTALDAKKSPECFLLQRSGKKFTVVYRGAIDDNAQSADDVDHYYLKEAMEKMLAKQKIDITEIRPVGCSIRKN